MTSRCLLRLFTFLIGLCVLLCCAACGTANWQAPLETRTPQDAAHRDTTTYQVQSGDTLYSIAWRHQLDVQHLARLNTIAPPYLIRPGQTLHLQHTTSPATTRPARSASRPPQTKPRPATRPARSTRQWGWPAQGRLASTFKSGDSLRNGIKLAVAPGTPVHASAAGRVVYSGGGLIGYGQLVIIKHDADYLSAYGHNRKLRVKTGQSVSKGMLIAESGKTQTGQPRLHVEIRYRGKPVNPLRLLPPR